LSSLNSPVLRYWYYFSNDQGDYPGEPLWVTQVSGDDGTTWKLVEQSNHSTNGWTSYVFRVSDYVTPSSNVRLRFIASDLKGSIVEAGVDDIEALSAPEGSSGVSRSTDITPAFGIASVHPNPLLRDGTITIDFAL